MLYGLAVNLKFKSIYEKAKKLDQLIDNYKIVNQKSFVPKENLVGLVLDVFPDGKLLGYGLYKVVFQLDYRSSKLVLKVGKSQAIELDHKAYKYLPHQVRHIYFAKMFWHTKYVLLQEFGVESEVSEQEFAQIRSLAAKYNLLDITCDNIRTVDGNHKIIDAAIAPQGLFRLWKTADYITLRLPSPLRKVLKKSLSLTYAR